MDRERQRQLDELAMRYLAAVDAGDLDALERLWAGAATDEAELFHGLNAALAAEGAGGGQG